MNRSRSLLSCITIVCWLASTSIVLAEEIHTQKNEPSAFVEDSWTVVVLPDTQNYVAEKTPNSYGILNNMMGWIVAEKDSRNIKAVVHVGDMTNNNSIEQWQLVRSSYKKLDNVVPYILCVGNHDENLKKGKEAKINDFFRISDNALNKAIFKGSYESEKIQNAYYIINQNGLKYFFLALEYSMRKSVIRWADKVIKDHQGHRVFITVHAYMSEASRLVSKDGRPDPNKRGSGYDIAGIFDRLVMPNPNVEFVTCGHVGPVKSGTEGKGPKGYEGVLVFDTDIATGHRSDMKANGLTVHQMLFNAQFIPNGGDGWMLLLEFLPNNKEVRVKTFSPYLNLWRTGPEYEYSLKRVKNKSPEEDHENPKEDLQVSDNAKIGTAEAEAR